MSNRIEVGNAVLYHGDCLEVLRTLPDNSIDSIVTDPPYGLSFMGKRWDYDVPSQEIWEECLRVLKPGGHMLVFAGTRTQHRMAVRIEDAGFEIRDMIAWVYGCLSEDSEVLTEDGWMPYNRAKQKNILAYDLQNDIYQWEKPSRWNEYRVESDTAYRIQSDHTDQIVSRGHRCIVERGGMLAFVPADELAGVERVPYLQGDFSELPQERGSQTVRARASYQTTLATVTAIEYSGLIWCPTVSTGAFVARRNGKVFITGNSGFPKSLDVSKAIDKAMGAERTERLSPKAGHENFVGRDNMKALRESGALSSEGGFSRPWMHDHQKVEDAHWNFAPATEAAKQWQGWGTALKPALETITVARKPLIGTVAENVLEHGTGALNIDGCRVGDEEMPRTKSTGVLISENGSMASGNYAREQAGTAIGRWPANIIHDGSPEVLAAFPETGASSGAPRNNNTSLFGKGGAFVGAGHADAGGSAARFFYCAKASKKDREEGLDGFEKRTAHRANNHPTVKPTDLMRYLVRLVTPPGGVVLDPFMGSGSTGKAAIRDGFRFIGIERESNYIEIAQARIAHAAKGKQDLTQPKGGESKDSPGQVDLFAA